MKLHSNKVDYVNKKKQRVFRVHSLARGPLEGWNIIDLAPTTRGGREVGVGVWRRCDARAGAAEQTPSKARHFFYKSRAERSPVM